MSAINCVTTVEPYCGHAVDSAAMHFAIELYACNKIQKDKCMAARKASCKHHSNSHQFVSIFPVEMCMFMLHPVHISSSMLDYF